jgi:nicotinamidase-related amidase
MLTTLDPATALVLIDLQNGIISQPTAHPIDAVLANAARLQSAFRARQLPVVVVHVEPIGAPASVVRAEQSRFPKDAAGQQQAQAQMMRDGFFDIADPVKPQPGDLQITKETWNAFYNTLLHEQLQSLGVTGIVLAGVSTSIGVEGTARSANERGYNLTFVTDAMTDSVGPAHDNSLAHIFPRIGELATTDAVIRALDEPA